MLTRSTTSLPLEHLEFLVGMWPEGINQAKQCTQACRYNATQSSVVSDLIAWGYLRQTSDVAIALTDEAFDCFDDIAGEYAQRIGR